MGLGVPFALFPFGFFCCYFKISVSLSNYLLNIIIVNIVNIFGMD